MNFDFIAVVRIILGCVFVLFLPGFVWSLIFLEADKTLISNADKNADMLLSNKNFSRVDRIILSIGLSSVISPLIVFCLSKIGIKINLINSAIEISALIIAGLIILLIQKFLTKKNAK